MKEKTLTVLEALGINYDSLIPFQKELLERNPIRFIIDSMISNKGDRTVYLELLWKVPAGEYHEKDKERLYYFEPRLMKLFEMCKFSRNRKYPAVPLAQEIEKYYHVSTGNLAPFFVELFESAWDKHIQDLDRLLFINNRVHEDLAFLFLISMKDNEFHKDYSDRLIKAKLMYPGLVGRALRIHQFKKDEELNDEDVKSFCLAHTYHNKERPIVKFYQKLFPQFNPEQRLKLKTNSIKTVNEYFHSE